VQWRLEECEEDVPASSKLAKAVREFRGYIEANQHFIPNYGERYRYEEAIATGFAEPTVNRVVSKWMSRNSRCAGRRKAPICYFKCAPRCSTTTSVQPSSAGI
jgi:hypothetical protein